MEEDEEEGEIIRATTSAEGRGDEDEEFRQRDENTAGRREEQRREWPEEEAKEGSKQKYTMEEHRKRKRRRFRVRTKKDPDEAGEENSDHPEEDHPDANGQEDGRVPAPSYCSSPSSFIIHPHPKRRIWRRNLWRRWLWTRSSFRSSSSPSLSSAHSSSPSSFFQFGATSLANYCAASASASPSRVSFPLLRSLYCFIFFFLLFFAAQLSSSAAALLVIPPSSSASSPHPPLLSSLDDDLSFMDSIWRIPSLPSSSFLSSHPNSHLQQHQSRDLRDLSPFWKPISDQMCHVWTSLSPGDLCSRNRWSRLRRMRELSLFTKCPEGFANLQLIELFHLDWHAIRTDDDLLAHTEHLREGARGRGCVLGAAGSPSCMSCFEHLQRALEQVEGVHWTFTSLLHRFDCRLAKRGLGAATRPFSPNTTCHNCAEWYRKWLLVNLVDMWTQPPCINWCYYTQLACPHLATNKVVEFAGHPVFLCKDQRLSGDPQRSPNCSCFHPCDLVQSRIIASSSPQLSQHFAQHQQIIPGSLPSSSSSAFASSSPFDYFPASSYCARRANLCGGGEHSAVRGRGNG